MLRKVPTIAADYAHYDEAVPARDARQAPDPSGDDVVAEGLVRCQTGGGFFRLASRPARDLGVLLAAHLGQSMRLRVLEPMAGCGIRSVRYGVEAGAAAIWANDADAGRAPLLQGNLAPLQQRGTGVTITAITAQVLLAGCLTRGEHFELVDLDAFGFPAALIPLALEAVALDGVLYLASSDGRSPTGHDRPSALRRLGASARAHPASWEQALRLQLGVIARSAWALGRGVTPLFSFSEGRTFRTAVRLRRRAAAAEEGQLGLLAFCHRCGDQQVQSLLRLRGWAACSCPGACGDGLAISGPLWIGALQDPATLRAMAAIAAARPACLDRPGARLLAALQADPGEPPRCWPLALIARHLGGGPPPLQALVTALMQRGHRAQASGVMAAQVRTDAPWPVVLQVASNLAGAGIATLNR